MRSVSLTSFYECWEQNADVHYCFEGGKTISSTPPDSSSGRVFKTSNQFALLKPIAGCPTSDSATLLKRGGVWIFQPANLLVCDAAAAQQVKVRRERAGLMTAAWWDLQWDINWGTPDTVWSQWEKRDRKGRETSQSQGETQLDPHDEEGTLFTYSNYLQLFRLHERLSMQTDWVQTWVGLI